MTQKNFWQRAIQWIWARGIYYPTLAWNIALGRLTHIRKWWHRVDEHLILGAVPLGNDIERLADEKVTGVINTCEEFAGPVKQYEKLGVEQLWIPTIDFTPPTLADVGIGNRIHRTTRQTGRVRLCSLQSWTGHAAQQSLFAG